ncbi:MAG: SDR family oxidoreductase [Pseudomonadota bacterium]
MRDTVRLPKTPAFRLDGKRALVTGASSGIGLASAVALAEAGAELLMVARGEARLREACEAVNAAGMSAHMAVLDVSDPAASRSLVDAHGPFDVLVNSAGLARHTPAVETVAADFDAVYDINVRGAYFISTAVAEGMLARGQGGSIIHISSQMAHVGGVDRAVYCSSKHAVEGFVKSMAIEWGPAGIRVNTVCPTFVRTPLTEQTFSRPERVAWIQEKIKLGRVAEVEDIMGPVLFLASDASAMVTGTSLLVDGGWTAD